MSEPDKATPALKVGDRFQIANKDQPSWMGGPEQWYEITALTPSGWKAKKVYG